jgi:hypothetical protein
VIVRDFNPEDIGIRCRVCELVKPKKEFGNIVWRVCSDCCKKSLRIYSQNLLTKKLCFFNIRGICCLSHEGCIEKNNCPDILVLPKEVFK